MNLPPSGRPAGHPTSPGAAPLPPVGGAKAEEIFNSALERSPEEREAYLAQACGDDVALLAEVRGLLGAHEAAGSFLDTEALHSPEIERALTRGKAEEAGDRIGPYQLLERIGEGGFGVVWMAEQEQPVQRRVALKIIKLGMDTKEVVARFEQERQALAMMDHPNIAKVFDAGATPLGRPYFVMELVQGTPVTAFCDARRLETRQRLALFLDIAAAIAHAHQKGVIHRDIKPSNVMVTLDGERPIPKVIDFGIAKAMQGRLTDKTLFTSREHFVGTPAYMAPEQASLSGGEIDARADIYGLGVLLYELLAGKPPFDPRVLRSAGYDEMRRMICEEEPLRPSLRVATTDRVERMVVAAARQIAPEELSRNMRGDLDWIVMKAMEKDRVRRYETPGELAKDIQRFLEDQPVSATPPSAGYKLRKFASRHRVVLRFAAALVALLVAGSAVSIWQAVRAARAEEQAEAQRQQAKVDEARAVAAEADASKKAADEAVARQNAETQRHRAEAGEARAIAAEGDATKKAAIKAATVFVKAEADGRYFSGSGFVIAVEGDAAYVLTNQHVLVPKIEQASPTPERRFGMPFPPHPFPTPHRLPLVAAARLNNRSGKYTVVFQSGTAKEETLPATVVVADSGRDLALLQVRGATDWPKPIDYLQEPTLTERMPVWTFGFPSGNAPATGRHSPALSVSDSSVSGVRRDAHGHVAMVQIDGVLNPGNSGGPVVDGQGQLIGMATVKEAGSPGQVIPSSQLSPVLATRLGRISLLRTADKDGSMTVHVEVGMVDPFHTIQSATLHYLPSEAAEQRPQPGDALELLPGCTELPLNLGKKKATGEFSWKADSAATSFWCQAICVTNDGQELSTECVLETIGPGIVAGASEILPGGAIQARAGQTIPGGGFDPDFREVAPEKGLLIGFEVGLKKFLDADIVGTVRPIFVDAQGTEVMGAQHGTDGIRTVSIRAKKGYAVGAITVSPGIGVFGFSATFMRVEKRRLDPADAYESEWIGGKRGREKRFGGTGAPIIGIVGKLGGKYLTGLGLLEGAMPP